MTRRPTRRLAGVAAVAAAVLLGAGLPATSAAAASDVTVQVTDTTARGDGSVPFATTGTWLSSALAGPDGAPSQYSVAAGASATWTLPAPAAGIYRLDAALPASTTSDALANYTVSGGSGASTTTAVDQRRASAAWVGLGWVDLAAGQLATVTLSRTNTVGSANTRASAVRLVADPDGVVPTPGGTGLPYAESWSGGMSGWTPLSGTLDSWAVEGGEVDAATIDNVDANSGSYLRPTAELDLPEDYTLRTSVRIDEIASNGTVSLLTDAQAPYSHIARNTALQFTPTGIKVARPNGGAVVCTGQAPFGTGEFFQVEITRAGGILAVRVNSQLVAAVAAGTRGGTIGIGAYKADARIGGIGVEALDTVPDDHPTTASGCGWSPSTGTGAPQPVIINQTGYDLGGPKRFTAPHADDGDAFEVVDADDAVVFSGTVEGQIGDFTAFDPASTGPFRILVHGAAGEGDSYEFGIGANWTERISYDNAIAFMSDVRCFYGELEGQPLNGTDQFCTRGLGWRDSHQMSFELSSLVDLYTANPGPIAAIRMPDAVYTGLQYPTADGSPEIARLIAWGAEIYLRGQYDHALIKEQLASFLWAYPMLSEWIPQDLYDDVRDYLFPIWTKASYSRYAWHDYTPHTADLTQVYTQIGTGKGEFPPGHSVVPNLRLAEVAEREGRTDADLYRDAALAQAAWLVDNVDLHDPLTTKGQRQGEYLLMTALATLAAEVPASELPAGLGAFATEWAEVAIERSANMWDFRRYSDDRWTIPSFTGGSSEDPNESGNVLGFPAAALAATTLITDEATNARLVEIAQAHVDDVFGRNPTGRAAQYRINDPELGFEGLDLGWFSEYQGGYGLLQGSHGVFDGSPKNGHYPFNTSVANIGHTEGWVTFNTAWLESLAWRAYTSTEVAVDAASAPADGTVGVTLRAPLNMDAAGGNTGAVQVSVDGAAPTALTVTQTGVNALDYTAELDLAALGAEAGDTVTVSYGLGTFARSATVQVTEAGEEPGEGGPGDEDPPTTVPTIVDPADADAALELDAAHFRLVDGELVAELGAQAAGGWYYAVVHSTPIRLGWFRADASGRVTVPVPAGLPAGTHTLQLYDASGALVAWGEFTVAAAPGPGGDLAATGASAGGAALAVLLAGCALLIGLILQRRRRLA